MTDKIEPALGAREWETCYVDFGDHMGLRWEFGGVRFELKHDEAQLTDADAPKDIASIIAACNAALPDSDPRKITRRDIEALRHLSAVVQTALERECGPAEDLSMTRVQRVADALESYLPPE